MKIIKKIVLAVVMFIVLRYSPGLDPWIGKTFAAQAKTVTIDTPDLCSRVENVSGKTVHLRSGQGRCPSKGPGKIQVSLEAGVQEVDIYVDGKLWKKQSTVVFDIGDVPAAMDKARKASEKMSVPKNASEEASSAMAKELQYYYESEEFQKKIDAEKDRLQRQLFGNKVQAYYPEAKAPNKQAKLSANERIYIFISSSVPQETLRTYVRTVSRLKDPNIHIAMRGFVGGARHIKPTMSFLKGLLLEDPSCNPLKTNCAAFSAQVMVDPMLFRKYRIEKVPAIVYVPSVSVIDDRMSEGLDSNTKTSEHFLVYGDVGFDYAIEQFLKERRSSGLDRLLSAYRNTFYK